MAPTSSSLACVVTPDAAVAGVVLVPAPLACWSSAPLAAMPENSLALASPFLTTAPKLTVMVEAAGSAVTPCDQQIKVRTFPPGSTAVTLVVYGLPAESLHVTPRGTAAPVLYATDTTMLSLAVTAPGVAIFNVVTPTPEAVPRFWTNAIAAR